MIGDGGRIIRRNMTKVFEPTRENDLIYMAGQRVRDRCNVFVEATRCRL